MKPLLSVARVIAPREALSLSQYAEQFRIVARDTSHYSGPWRNSLAPHLVEPMDALTDPSIHTVALWGPAQSSKTELIINALQYYIHWEPSPILVVMPDDSLVSSFSKERLTPTIQASPVLSEIIDTSNRRDSFNRIDEKIFPGGSLFMGSSATANTYAQRARRLVIADDVDQIAHDIKGQGDFAGLMEKRTESFPNRKILYCGTTTDETSHIMRLWKRGDRRTTELPCPHCGEYQSLKSENFIYESHDEYCIPGSVQYPCTHCGELIPEEKADWMRARVRWKRKRKTAGIASFCVEGGAYDAGWKPWSSILTEVLRSKDQVESYKTVWNVTLNRVWQNRTDAPSWEVLAGRQKMFKRGEIPEGALVLTLAVDVQADRLEALLVGWGRAKQRYVIEHYMFGGDPANVSTWKPLEVLINSTWPIPLICTGIDSGDGHETAHVYDFVRSCNSDRVIALKGSSRYLETYIDTARHIDLRLSGKRSTSGVKVWMVGTGMIKSELYSYYRLQKKDGEYPPGYIHFADGFPDEFYEQATAETLAAKTVAGVRRWRWIKLRERNEILDLLVYTTACAASRGWHTWTDAHWTSLEKAKQRNMEEARKVLQESQQRRRKYGNVNPGLSL